MKKMDIEKRIASSNKWGLVALLHEGLIDQCKKSIKAIEDKNHETLNKSVNRNRDLLTELIILFKDEDQVSTDLREIYLYINTMITDGEIEKDPIYFFKIIEVIEPILEGFRELEVKEDPNIVTGLTYGKMRLEEHKKSEKEFKG